MPLGLTLEQSNRLFLDKLGNILNGKFYSFLKCPNFLFFRDRDAKSYILFESRNHDIAKAEFFSMETGKTQKAMAIRCCLWRRTKEQLPITLIVRCDKVCYSTNMDSLEGFIFREEETLIPLKYFKRLKNVE